MHLMLLRGAFFLGIKLLRNAINSLLSVLQQVLMLNYGSTSDEQEAQDSKAIALPQMH